MIYNILKFFLRFPFQPKQPTYRVLQKYILEHASKSHIWHNSMNTENSTENLVLAYFCHKQYPTSWLLST